ncbi:hypothetical protein [Maioricimonas sp. JC845]|uniref:hypothetical protein n=1 Tax=Maioricimonas sp. JC845 TaxID=3232138 RepID=UPI003457A674
MLQKCLKSLFCLSVLALMVLPMGCGGEGGVADAPDEPAPELTPEEVAGEEAYTNSPEHR